MPNLPRLPTAAVRRLTHRFAHSRMDRGIFSGPLPSVGGISMDGLTMRIVFLLTFAAFCTLDGATSWARAGKVGFSVVQVPDGANPPIQVGLWYPAAGVPQPTRIEAFVQTVVPDAAPLGHDLPLVVISHGNGSSLGGHSDTALALARAGFVVAAPTHTGDNYRDQSRALDVAGRARQLGRVIDYVLLSWKPHAVDAGRVGAFGFSSGGLTVLIAAGGDPDLARVGPHCSAHPGFFDCRLMAEHPQTNQAAGGFPHDPRIRAIAIAAPALGFTFDRARLARVTQPVQLWRAGDDAVLPSPFYADAVQQALPRAPEFHDVPHAGHFDFLAPCPPGLAHAVPAICTSEAGFDRTAFHEELNASLVDFFARTLHR
jgi:predicted dienelactone hydrolase